MRTFKLKKLKRVQSIHFTSDGARLLAVGGMEARGVETAVWLDLATGENVGRIDQYAHGYAVPPDLSRYVLVGANEWEGIAPVQWTALPAGRDWHPFPGVPSGRKSPLPALRAVYAAAFDASGTRLAVAHGRRTGRGPHGWQYQVAVMRFDSPELLASLSPEHGPDTCVFDAGATRLATTGGMDAAPSVEVFDLPGGTRAYRFDPPGTVTRCVLFLPGGRLVVANGRNVYVLPPDRPEPLFTLAGYPKQVNAVAVTKDGRRLLTASHDGTIRVWDAATGKPLTSFDWQVGPVTAVAFAPDGLTCAAAGLNGKVVVWDVDA